MKKFFLYHWGMDADETGLRQKVNWGWFWKDTLKWGFRAFLIFIIVAFIILFWAI